jgi:hypothetical protein
MKRSERRTEGPGVFELIEEAVHLLRMNAAVALPSYYLGSLPFVLGLLFFWADMSRSPFAEEHLIEASLTMALLFVWMKFWQAMFADSLRARISANPPTRWNLRRALRVLLIQTAIQPSGVVLLPLAMIPALLPFPFVFAFYQNVTALSDGETAEIGKPLKRALRQAGVWQGQGVVMLAVLAVFGFCVFLNLVTVALALPGIAKTLLGVDSVYTHSRWGMLNSTFFAAMLGMTYLCVDPIVKTVYLLRCFYGESLKSGEDLRAELKRLGNVARPAVAGIILVLCLVCAGNSRAADGTATPPPANPPGTQSVSTPGLDKAIDDVIHEPKYTWRMSREKAVEQEGEENAVLKFLRGIFRAMGHWIARAINWVIDFVNKYLLRNKVERPTTASTMADTISMLQVFMFVLLAAVLSALVILIIRVWRGRRRVSTAVVSEAIAPVPDLKDENVGADELPEDGWIKLGRELLGCGEFRLAMRAFYFASLAHLAARSLVTIAKFKSNRDYERELGRRGHSLPEALALFRENVSVFDRTWYGLHEINGEMVNRFLANVERIKTA